MSSQEPFLFSAQLGRWQAGEASQVLKETGISPKQFWLRTGFAHWSLVGDERALLKKEIKLGS